MWVPHHQCLQQRNGAGTRAEGLRDNLGTENILRQAYAIKDRELPMLLRGIRINTSSTDHVPVDQMQFMRFSGKQWERFGHLQSGN